MQATFHYDANHNCYAQLIGRKRFWLLPPTTYAHMHIFPVNHPSDRQSQVPWTPHLDSAGVQALREAFPSFASISDVILADLEPGDVLALPSGWFHYVEAVTASVSGEEKRCHDPNPLPPHTSPHPVNVWTESQAMMDMSKVFQNPLPWYSSFMGKEALRGRVRTLFALVIPPLSVRLGYADSRAFLRKLVEQKYAPLFPQERVQAAFDCGTEVPPYRILEEHAAWMRAFFERMSAETMEVYLHVWLESIAEYTVGPENIPRFLASCL
jgi:hypothetical protein